MISLDIPGFGNCQWRHLVLDLNGTLAHDGELIAGVSERIAQLREKLDICLLTADTRGTATQLAGELGIRSHLVERGQEAEQKERFVRSLGQVSVVAIGNGNNDVGMLAAAGLGIAVLGPEGTASRALTAADLVVCDICSALELLLFPQRLFATLRY